MTDQISFPPLHDLPPSEFRTRREHLLSEIGRDPASAPLSRSRFTFPRRRWRVISAARPILVVPVVVVAALALVPIGGASLGTRAVDGITSLLGTPSNQPALDAAADDAEAIAGPAYYTDARVDDAANTVDLHLAGAPQSIIDQLQAKHPGTYVIDNGAAHPLSELLRVEHSLRLGSVQYGGASIDLVDAYPSPDGYLKIGVAGSGDVQVAQAALDSLYGTGIIQVYGGAQPMQMHDGGPVPTTSLQTRAHQK